MLRTRLCKQERRQARSIQTIGNRARSSRQVCRTERGKIKLIDK